MQLQEREKKFLILGGLAIVLIGLYHWGLAPLLASQKQIKEQLAGAKMILAKSSEKIARQNHLTKETAALEQKISQAEKRLLKGKTPALAAAELQKIIKGMANRYNVKISSEKILAPEEAGEYQKIPVQVTFKGLLSDLKTVFYHIENNPTALPIGEAKIKVLNTRNPSEVEAVLTVSGIIIKTETPPEEGSPASGGERG